MGTSNLQRVGMAGVVAALSAFTVVQHSSAVEESSVPHSHHYSSLPSRAEARALLDATHHHPEWVTVAANDRTLMAVVSYPDRPDGAPVVVVAAADEKLTPWVRAVADQLTYEGYIAVVPDAVASDVAGIAAAAQQLSQHPAASGRNATVRLAADLEIDSGNNAASFALSQATWPAAMDYLQSITDNDRNRVVRLPGQGTGHGAGHAGHGESAPVALRRQPAAAGASSLGAAAPMGAAAPAQGPGSGAPPPRGPRGYPVAKLEHLPAGLFTAKTTLLRSPIRSEQIDIPTPGIYNGRINTRITYPAGTAPAGIVVLMQHGPGNDDWMHAVGDQLSRQGFIALSPDLHTGMGPGGGNYASFAGPEDVFAASAKLDPAMTQAAYEAVRQYGLKLPRANGKSAAMGFCMGGTNAWVMAMNAPDLNAAIVYYGGGRPDEAAMAKIDAPVIAFSGTDDARVTTVTEQMGAVMKKLGKRFEFHEYEHATHGFLEFQDLGGNAPATLDSWTRSIALLNEQLR